MKEGLKFRGSRVRLQGVKRRRLASDLILVEYKQLKAEIESLLAQISVLARWAAVGSAGVWSWALTQEGSLPLWILAFVPLGLTVVLGLQALAAHHHIRLIGKYLRIVESKHFFGRRGWEKWFRHRSGKMKKAQRVFWGGLLAFNFVVMLGFLAPKICAVAVRVLGGWLLTPTLVQLIREFRACFGQSFG